MDPYFTPITDKLIERAVKAEQKAEEWRREFKRSETDRDKVMRERDSLAIDLRETEVSLDIMRERAEEAEQQRDELLRIVREISAAWDGPSMEPQEFFRFMAGLGHPMRAAIAKIEGGDNAKG